MKRMIKISAFVFAAIFGAASMTACRNSSSTDSQNQSAVETSGEQSDNSGASSMASDENSNSIPDTQNDSAAETADEQSDNAEPETSSEVENNETENAYAPTDEIMNADFQSGKIQIGNDVFRNGGYYTVDQFVAEYGDRYDMSAIDTEAEMNEKLNYANAVIISRSDPEIQISVEYVTPNEKIRTGDAVVVEVKPNRFTSDGPFVCYPAGQQRIDSSRKFTDGEQFCEALGFKKLEDIDEQKKLYDAYGFVSDSMYPDRYVFRVKGSDENLFEAYPIYIYFITGNDEHMTTELNEMVFWKNLSKAYISANETE